MLSKYFKTSMIFLALALSLTACGQKKGSESVNKARSNGRVTGSGIVPQNIMSGTYQANVWTLISADRQYQESFQQMVRTLVSPSLDPNAIGAVAADGSNNTGVYMQGFVDLNADRSINVNNAILKIMIQDEYVGQKDSEGREIKAYPIVIPTLAQAHVQASATVPGATDINLTFRDSVGEITLVGTLSSNQYRGNIKFKNFAPKGDNKEYWLGSFNTSMCAIFNCK
jgi:hypothetical protein